MYCMIFLCGFGWEVGGGGGGGEEQVAVFRLLFLLVLVHLK